MEDGKPLEGGSIDLDRHRLLRTRDGSTLGETSYHRDGKLLKSSLIALALCVAGTLALGLVLKVVIPHVPASGASAAQISLKPPAANALTSRLTAGKPPAPNALSYRADRSGHFFVDAVVNGTPVHFLVDTGATLVALSPEDALAIGMSRGALSYTEKVSTAHGEARVARTTLREVRVNQLSIEEVPAVVMEQPSGVSLLGMSFLSRLGGYSIRDGVLTIEW
jgi:aspartyl protease family protein